jgi:hypothetical protein
MRTRIVSIAATFVALLFSATYIPSAQAQETPAPVATTSFTFDSSGEQPQLRLPSDPNWTLPPSDGEGRFNTSFSGKGWKLDLSGRVQSQLAGTGLTIDKSRIQFGSGTMQPFVGRSKDKNEFDVPGFSGSPRYTLGLVVKW